MEVSIYVPLPLSILVVVLDTDQSEKAISVSIVAAKCAVIVNKYFVSPGMIQWNPPVYYNYNDECAYVCVHSKIGGLRGSHCCCIFFVDFVVGL